MRAVTVADSHRVDPPSAAPRLTFLDGLRGLAALYVVFHHAALFVPAAGLGGPASLVRFLLRHGHYAVPVFITLSGYSLMSRAVASPGGGLPGGLGRYLVRRARRILPPYYAALVFCWLLTAALPLLRRPSLTPWDRALPSFPAGVVVSHLFLVHNLEPGWIYRVAPPFWTLATEWQIYVLFPVLLWVARRRGVPASVAAGFAVGSAVLLLSVLLGNPALRDLCPWYAGLFALGMAGASASRPGGLARPGAPAAAALALSVALALLSARATGRVYLLVTDTLTGLATSFLVARCARASSLGVETRALRLLGSRRLVSTGSYSYSLYLTHYPLLAVSYLWLRDLGFGPDALLALLLCASAPFCVTFAFAFSLLFERFLRPGDLKGPSLGVPVTLFPYSAPGAAWACRVRA